MTEINWVLLKALFPAMDHQFGPPAMLAMLVSWLSIH